MKSNSLVFIIISIFCLLQQKAAADDPILVQVVVKNAISDSHPLTVHCFSRDTDEGSHVLNVNDVFRFNFDGVFIFTNYFCDFWWNGSHALNNQVVNKFIFQNYCENFPSPHRNICFWQVQVDGMYVSNTENPQPGQLKKVFGWDK